MRLCAWGKPGESARLNKGSSRSFNPIEERLQLIADLQSVDYVFAFEMLHPMGQMRLSFIMQLRQLKPHN